TIASLAAGATQTLTKSATITQTTTNVATATAQSCTPPTSVQASATVTVVPPPPCTVTDKVASLADDEIGYELSAGNNLGTLDTLTLNFRVGRGDIKEVKLNGVSIYKSDQSNLVVGSGVTIGSTSWTNADATKRRISAGATVNLEISFTAKT